MLLIYILVAAAPPAWTSIQIDHPYGNYKFSNIVAEAGRGSAIPQFSFAKMNAELARCLHISPEMSLSPVLLPKNLPEMGPGPVCDLQFSPEMSLVPTLRPQPFPEMGPGPILRPQKFLGMGPGQMLRPQPLATIGPGPVIRPQPFSVPGPGSVLYIQTSPQVGPGPVHPQTFPEMDLGSIYVQTSQKVVPYLFFRHQLLPVMRPDPVRPQTSTEVVPGQIIRHEPIPVLSTRAVSPQTSTEMSLAPVTRYQPLLEMGPGVVLYSKLSRKNTTVSPINPWSTPEMVPDPVLISQHSSVRDPILQPLNSSQ